jgi:4-amino-4-deoxy-L-arabinose transferase-like glycosyltransferase
MTHLAGAKPGEKAFRSHSQSKVLLIVLVAAVAALLRLAEIDRYPQGLYYDEAAYAMDAVDTLRSGQWPVFYHTHSGKEPLWIWMLAAVFSVAGVGALQIRLLAAAVGIASVVAVWWVGHEIFSYDDETCGAGCTERASWLGLIAAAVLATMFFHVHLSRDGYRLLTQPLISSLAMAALWRALRGKPLIWFAVAGVLLGLSLYTYTSARFNGVLLVVFFLLQMFTPPRVSDSLVMRYWRPLLMALGLTLVLVAPMVLDLAAYPEFLFERSREVSVFNPTWNGGQPLLALLDSVGRNLAGIVWRGTDDTHWNIPGRPLLDFLTIPLFLVGTAVAARRWKQPANLFTLLWLLTLYVPAFLSYDRVPVFHRAVGVLPAVALLVALGAWESWQWLGRLLRRPAWSSAIVPLAAILIVSGSVAARDYFLSWAPSWNAYLATQPFYIELVERMNNETEQSTVYLIPYDLRNGIYNHPVFGLFHNGLTPYHFISDHEGRVRQELSAAVKGKTIVRVVDWKVGRSMEADPKHLISTLLTMHGRSLSIDRSSPAYDIESFALANHDIDFTVMPTWSSLNATVGDGLVISSFAVGPCGQAVLRAEARWHLDQCGWVALVWQSHHHLQSDYKASVRLVDEDNVLAQSDKVLLNGFHLRTSQWRVGEENYDVYLLTPQREGRYELLLVVYDEATGTVLLSEGIKLPILIEVGP